MGKIRVGSRVIAHKKVGPGREEITIGVVDSTVGNKIFIKHIGLLNYITITEFDVSEVKLLEE